MRKWIVLAGAFIVSASAAIAGESVKARWDAVRVAREWVTALAESSHPAKVPAPVNRIIVVGGGDERLVYEAKVNDFVLGEPVIARDGSRLAFRKVEQIGDRNHDRLYVMNRDGTGLRAIVEFERPGVAFKGAIMGGASTAWSFDNRFLVSEGDVDHPSVRARRSLVLVDLQSGEVVQLAELESQRLANAHRAITSQAWAPDNRRIVYTNEEGHAIILDTVSGARVDIGPGRSSAWAPDGRFIAVQEPGAAGEIRQGDYVLIQPEHPHQRIKLLSNARRWFSPWRFGYLGPPVWMPDSRLVVVFHQERNQSTPYVLDSQTGEIEKLPPRFVSESWGGKP